jgi:predicted DNA-binding transcriptional regulator YafY
MRYRREGHVYVVNPYALHWDGNKYYLIGYYPEHGITHFRVDKITEIEIREAACVNRSEDLDLVSYVQKTFSMFGGPTEKVALRFDNDLIGAVIDRFGTDIVLQKVDEQTIATEADVNVSPSFLSWVFQFGGKVVITGPDGVVAQMKQLLERQCKLYKP